MAEFQTFVDGSGDPIKDGFQDAIKELLGQKLEGDGLSKENHTEAYNFINKLSHKLGWGYSDYDPYTNGNYAVFMNHGPWLDAAESSSGNHLDYISYLDTVKKNNSNSSKLIDQGDIIGSILNFSQSITDIDIPEPSKEYIAVSTRQKNSFVNTRDFSGSDFNLTFVENKNLDVFKYHEMWHKSIELIREGLLYVPGSSINTNTVVDANDTTSPYLIPNPYANATFVLLFKPKSFEVTGLIVLYGVMPINLPFKNLIGDRSGSKVATYTMNYKFMDMQYAFYDGWDNFQASASDSSTIAHAFANFAKIVKQVGK